MKTKRQIMSEAHQIAKTFEGNYTACLSEALRISWQNAKENFTPEFIIIANAKIEECSVKEIFEILNNGFNHIKGEFSALATEVLEVVINKSNGFQQDIAKKAYYENKELTYKQAWCVAYEYKKVA